MNKLTVAKALSSMSMSQIAQLRSQFGDNGETTRPFGQNCQQVGPDAAADFKILLNGEKIEFVVFIEALMAAKPTAVGNRANGNKVIDIPYVNDKGVSYEETRFAINSDGEIVGMYILP
jgi:hypothetical protein